MIPALLHFIRHSLLAKADETTERKLVKAYYNKKCALVNAKNSPYAILPLLWTMRLR